MNNRDVLRAPFNIEVHKETFINYLEVIIEESGTVVYAVPSHQRKLIAIACKKLNITENELNDLCPPEYYFNFMHWLCMITKCVAVWNEFYIGDLNDFQKETLDKLHKHELYKGTL